MGQSGIVLKHLNTHMTLTTTSDCPTAGSGFHRCSCKHNVGVLGLYWCMSGVQGSSSGDYGGGSSHHSGSGRYGGGCVQFSLSAGLILTSLSFLCVDWEATCVWLLGLPLVFECSFHADQAAAQCQV